MFLFNLERKHLWILKITPGGFSCSAEAVVPLVSKYGQRFKRKAEAMWQANISALGGSTCVSEQALSIPAWAIRSFTFFCKVFNATPHFFQYKVKESRIWTRAPSSALRGRWPHPAVCTWKEGVEGTEHLRAVLANRVLHGARSCCPGTLPSLENLAPFLLHMDSRMWTCLVCLTVF